jgi:hypothetical protein
MSITLTWCRSGTDHEAHAEVTEPGATRGAHFTFRITPARYGDGYRATVSDGWRWATIADGVTLAQAKEQSQWEASALENGDLEDTVLYENEGDDDE